MLRHDIGLKSFAEDALVILGIRINVVSFHCFSSFPDLKNSPTASQTSGPMTDQQPVKNSAEYPSGPLVLFLGSEKKAALISSNVNCLDNLSFCSVEQLAVPQKKIHISLRK